ncbi:hypothetical protein P168DRAFT_318164 [Aspergillus campestris IBT 28561]|uniref:Secreted protein n=1 Tax=Aspergillus campestris (strain IBT 28561) TaxID=1392248 RepID=A0A2I1D5I2_ASPC2|nr:uncharacterized protein P168DRAFT_318164 [Aspergillus campestris IBT 28561]PKY05136.1 hypothetical protein P168DRAFT_318164 [Aspergillus campestris IBT 28561]
MKFYPIIALFLAALPLGTHAICADGEVGIGTNTICQIGTPESGSQCSGAEGVIYANNCHYIATGSLQGYCHGGWPSGYNVKCSGDAPSRVTTTGGNFSNCYKISAGNWSKGPLQYVFVDYCCKRV